MAGNKLPVVADTIVELPAELTTLDQVKAFIQQTISRRSFVGGMGVAGLGAVAFQFGCASDPKSATPRQVYVPNAKGMIVADPGLCVGCRRCESACSGYNEGVARPAVSNIKVNRNVQYGVEGTWNGSRGMGLYGNFRIVQDTCRQCPHPVPCQLACPNAAIEVAGDQNARIVNADKCVGCGICVYACPREKTALDGPVKGENTKSHKCHLCAGQLGLDDGVNGLMTRPNCVEACPAGALQFVPWDDRTDVVPTRQVVTPNYASDVKDTCKQCH